MLYRKFELISTNIFKVMTILIFKKAKAIAHSFTTVHAIGLTPLLVYRHPLQELCVNTFVPNDTVSDSSHGTMKILTGANASGKSVYLTQVLTSNVQYYTPL